MKKLNLLVALVIVSTGLAGYLHNESISSYVSAQIMSLNNATALKTTLIPPKSPDFLNSFNVYAETRSELGQIEIVAGNVLGESPETMAAYQAEIFSYVDRLMGTVQEGRHLPMWPDHNIAVNGNTLAYLFPNELDPLAFAKNEGIVPVDAQPNAYLSRAEFLNIIGHVFISDGREPATVLAELGFIDSALRWRNVDRSGFPLLEGISLILDIRELIERKNILASKEEYSNNLSFIPGVEPLLDESTLMILVRAFATESETDFQQSILDSMKNSFSSRYGAKMTSRMITDVRGAYFRAMNKRMTPVYQLPEYQLIGDCNNEVFRKTYMGPVAVTGPKGANIICDKVLLYFPANSYVINVFSLPKITVLDLDDQLGVATVRTDVMRSYKNALIVNGDGEQRVQILVRPRAIARLDAGNFGITVEDLNGTLLVELVKDYSSYGALIELELRSFIGDQLIRFKYAL